MPTSTHLEHLASQPRPVGSPANARARAYCAAQLRSLGFQVTERPFEFSALPGRHAAQIIGVVAVVGFVGARSLFAPVFGLLTIILIALLGMWLNSPGATREPWFRTSGVNLEATRGVGPRVWLVAHIDSKSQPISTAFRTLGVVALSVGAITSVGPVIPFGIPEILAIAGGIILCFAAVGSKSDGAADNASGVAAVLEATALIPAAASVGVLITDAEELALAGATAWVHQRERGIAINCDTIDDIGRLVVFKYGPMSRSIQKHAGSAARSVDPLARVMRPPPGVLTDSNAFHRAGWETVTLARGTIRTLNRIHTERDSLKSMRGTGIPDAARVLARIAEELA